MRTCSVLTTSVSGSISIPILVIGLVALLGLSELIRHHNGFSGARDRNLSNCARGILSTLPRVRSGLDLMAIPNSPERSLNVATAMVDRWSRVSKCVLGLNWCPIWRTECWPEAADDPF